MLKRIKTTPLSLEHLEPRMLMAALVGAETGSLSSESVETDPSSGVIIASGSGEVCIGDDFEDGIFNGDGNWDPNNIAQGGEVPATIDFNEATLPGSLRVTYTTAGVSQTTMILREDVTLEVGDYVQVDVAFAGGEATHNVRFGVGLSSSLGRNAVGGWDRDNVLYWGLRNDGRVRGHYYGDNGTEIGDGEVAISGYLPGKFMTIAIRRVSETGYELYAAPTGTTLQLAQTFDYTGSTGVGETPPMIPGLFLDNGLRSFLAVVDNFKVGTGWPPPVNPSRPDAPREIVALPPGEIGLDLSPGVGALPQLQSTQHQVNFPVGNGDNTYHHGPELTFWNGKLYLAWHSTPENEMTLPYIPLVSSSVDGKSWSTTFNIGSATGDAAYEAYTRDRFNIPARETIFVNAAPRNWHATDDTLYLWSLGWVTRANGDRQWAGRIWFTHDGVTWKEIPPQTLDALEQNSNLLVRDTGSNRGFIQLSDGRLMAATLGPARPGGRIAAPITSDPTGLTGWSGGVIDTSASTDVGEPGGWEGPDGTLHYTARGPNQSVWHAYSTDGGQTWSPLESMGQFPDSPGNKKFGRFSNDWIWYVGTPVPNNRRELVFTISRDGWLFDESYTVRDEPITPIWPSKYKTGEFHGYISGYEYPTAYYSEEDDTLYVAYSRTRDYIEVTKIVGANLLPPVGDYNQDRTVDNEDYNFWRSQFGATSGAGLAADGNNDGTIDAADYVVWRKNLGTTYTPPIVPGGSSSQLQGAGNSMMLIAAIPPLAADEAIADFPSQFLVREKPDLRQQPQQHSVSVALPPVVAVEGANTDAEPAVAFRKAMRERPAYYHPSSGNMNQLLLSSEIGQRHRSRVDEGDPSIGLGVTRRTLGFEDESFLHDLAAHPWDDWPDGRFEAR